MSVKKERGSADALHPPVAIKVETPRHTRMIDWTKLPDHIQSMNDYMRSPHRPFVLSAPMPPKLSDIKPNAIDMDSSGSGRGNSSMPVVASESVRTTLEMVGTDPDTSIPAHTFERMTENLRMIEQYGTEDDLRLASTRDTIAQLKRLVAATPETVEEIAEQATARTSLFWHEQQERVLAAQEEKTLLQRRLAYYYQLTASMPLWNRQQMFAWAFRPEDTLVHIDNKDECRECGAGKSMEIEKRLSVMQCTCSLMTPVVTWRSNVRVGTSHTKGQSGWSTSQKSNANVIPKESKSGTVTSRTYETFKTDMDERVDRGPTAEDDMRLQQDIADNIRRYNHLRTSKTWLKGEIDQALKRLEKPEHLPMSSRIAEAMNNRKRPRLTMDQFQLITFRMDRMVEIATYGAKDQSILELPSPRFVYQQMCNEHKWVDATRVFPFTPNDQKFWERDVERYKRFTGLLSKIPNPWSMAPMPVASPTSSPVAIVSSPSPISSAVVAMQVDEDINLPQNAVMQNTNALAMQRVSMYKAPVPPMRPVTKPTSQSIVYPTIANPTSSIPSVRFSSSTCVTPSPPSSQDTIVPMLVD